MVGAGANNDKAIVGELAAWTYPSSKLYHNTATSVMCGSTAAGRTGR